MWASIKRFISRAIRNFVEAPCVFKIKMQPNCEDYVPTKAHITDAGYDLYAAEEVEIPAGRVKAVSVGFKCELPINYELQIRPRSGMASNYITVANTPGTVDCNYRGVVKVLLYNFGEFGYTVKQGDRIAQGVIAALPVSYIKEVEQLSESDRGSDGFGSSGK